MKGTGMGGECNTHGSDAKCMQNRRDHFEDLSVDEKRILK
jgi:hypothetical protein